MNKNTFLSLSEIARRKIIIGAPSISKIRRLLKVGALKAINVSAGEKQARWRVDLAEIDSFNKNISKN